MYKIIEEDFFDKCTGCAACQNVCPQNAIYFRESFHTFSYPEIDVARCVECGLCARTCPVNREKRGSADHLTIYAARAEDEIREKSSSGGMYSVFAEQTIKKGGVVYGTTLTDEQKVCFVRISSEEEIGRCNGSKYVQSEVGLVFREVKNDLNMGTKVLFFGCPCHISGLKSFLGKEYENLITVDLICHGVPSQKLFSMYLKGKEIDKISDVKFRDKSLGWRADAIKIEFKNSMPYIRSLHSGDEYEKGFQKNIILRNCCERCKFSEFPKEADITIGDFWGCEKYLSNDGKGTSLVVVNTLRGAELYSKVECKLILSKKLDVTIDELKQYNRLFEFYPHSKQKELFFEHLETKPFEQAMRMADEDQYDVGIVGIPTVENFGGSLTYVALYYALREMKKTCFFVERPTSSKHPPSALSKIYYCSPFPCTLRIYDEVKDKEGLMFLNTKTSCFLVGSDQLFHHNLYNNFSHYVTLDWVNDNKTKAAYAASFGHDRFTGDELERAEMSYFMKKFDAFSVRESSGVKIAKETFGVDAVQVLDPVFLCSPEIYREMAKNAKFICSQPYIAAYILDPDLNKEKLLKTVATFEAKALRIFSEMFYTAESIKAKWGLDIQIGKIEDRLSCIEGCDLLITDSFHGVCFAIILKKNFIAIKNPGRGIARLESLLHMLGLQDRLLSGNEEEREILSIVTKKIDYSAVSVKLVDEIKKSRKWLEENVRPKVKPFSDYDILNQKLREKEIENREKFDKILKYLKLAYSVERDLYKYLDYLIDSKEKLLVAIAAKDTPGMAFTQQLCSKLKLLGLVTDFMHSHWCGYIALIYKGVVIKERCEFEKSIYEEFIKGDLRIEIKSAPLHRGNNASILINGAESAVNSRGLNFVVYDVEKKYVTDKVAFDTHVSKFSCTRIS